MRAVHADPQKMGGTSTVIQSALKTELQKLIDRGLFYLRYTVGDPADNMRSKGMQVTADYISRYANELQTLEFEPEKAFETLIEYPDGDGGALISGAIDLFGKMIPRGSHSSTLSRGIKKLTPKNWTRMKCVSN